MEVEATGRHVTVRAACMTYVVGDLVVTHRDYYDQLELYSQLGFGLTELPRTAGQASRGVIASAAFRSAGPDGPAGSGSRRLASTLVIVTVARIATITPARAAWGSPAPTSRPGGPSAGRA